MPNTDPAVMIRPGAPLLSTLRNGPVAFGTVERSHVVRDLVDGSEATLVCAAAALARVEREVDGLWRHALSTERREISERLVDVSHVLRRASRLLEGDPEIG